MKRYDIRHREDLYLFLEDSGLKFMNEPKYKWLQFENCQAWYCKVKLQRNNGETVEAYILQSYNTLVAIYFPKTDECIRFRKYSSTTSKQTTQWHNMLSRATELVARMNGKYNINKSVEDFIC